MRTSSASIKSQLDSALASKLIGRSNAHDATSILLFFSWMRHPFYYFSPEGHGAMHTGIIEHHNGERVRVFLSHKRVEGFDDRLGRH